MYERRDPDRTGDSEPSQRSGVSPTLIAIVVVAVLAVIFIVQNGERRSIEFLFVDVTLPVWVALLIAIGIGVLLDRLFASWWKRRKNKTSDR